MNLFKRKQSSPAQSWARPYDLAPLVERLAALDVGDPLYPLLLGFLDQQMVSQCSAVLDQDSIAMFAGRVKMCADLKEELGRVWLRSHQPPKKT